MNDDIKTMKLYHQVGRVFNELSNLGIADDADIDVTTLCQFDQYHYHGTEAVAEAISKLQLNDQMRVLEVGAGIGGPARFLSHTCGCHMTAMELQADLNETAEALTRRCGLADKVDHVCGDILDGVPGEGQFDALVSWLTFLHISDRKALYKVCMDSLKPGAGMFFEDYFERGDFSDAERESLSREIYCDHLPTMQNYQTELAEAGFERIELIDMTASWTEFVHVRLKAFEAAYERNVSLHGEATTKGLQEFYSAVDKLFSSGNLGGICAIGYKPD
ncbi:MAG: cyclopropane fatty-acyl-phospholipid synthase-like methyltransferase [Parasphingorhabdus sp.]|jgi:cyclopropane fatty-acyl-phospholipid synthase-like methyltransferase